MAPRQTARAQSPDGRPRRSHRLANSTSMASLNGVAKHGKPKRNESPNRKLAVDERLAEEVMTPPMAPPLEYEESRWTEDPDNDDYNQGFSQEADDDMVTQASHGDTQPFSQDASRQRTSHFLDLQTERDKGVWGYLFPYYKADGGFRIVLSRDMPKPPLQSRSEKAKAARRTSQKAKPLSFTIGRRQGHVDLCIDKLEISNLHCTLFLEDGDVGEVVLHDKSLNGTYVCDQLVGRNQTRVLRDRDIIDLGKSACFTFRMPCHHQVSQFRAQYNVLEELGRGANGVVYRAVQKTSGNQYAVKAFYVNAANESIREALRKEQAMLLAVDHPNCVNIKEIFHERDFVYLVLELAGGELFDLVAERGGLHENLTRDIFQKIFAGVKHLHDSDIVHRDLKPENILIREDDPESVKICDFGLAKIISGQTMAHTMCGTEAYAAPEILNEVTARPSYDKSVDIWSLGVILFVCLVGYPPFSDELASATYPKIREQICRGMYKFDARFWRHISQEAIELIESMLVVDPHERLTIDECIAHPWFTASGTLNHPARLSIKRPSLVRIRTLTASQAGRESPFADFTDDNEDVIPDTQQQDPYVSDAAFHSFNRDAPLYDDVRYPVEDPYRQEEPPRRGEKRRAYNDPASSENRKPERRRKR